MLRYSLGLFFFFFSFLMICWSFKFPKSAPIAHCPSVYGVIILSLSLPLFDQPSADRCHRVTETAVLLSPHSGLSFIPVRSNWLRATWHSCSHRWVGWAELQRALLLFNLTWLWSPRQPASLCPGRIGRHMMQRSITGFKNNNKMLLIWFVVHFVTNVWL